MPLFSNTMVKGIIGSSFRLPDMRDRWRFDATRRRVALCHDFVDVASLGDAGLKFLAEYTTRSLRSKLESGCRVNALGIAKYFHSSNATRTAVLNIPPDMLFVRRYRILHREFRNMYEEFAWSKSIIMVSRKTKAKKRAGGAKETRRGDKPRAAGLSVPAGRGRIADNLSTGRPWYENLPVPLGLDRARLEASRKRNKE